MLAYNLLNLCLLVCTYFLVTDSGKENLLTNVKPSFTHGYFKGFSGHARNGEECQRSAWLAVTEEGVYHVPGRASPQACIEDCVSGPKRRG